MLQLMFKDLGRRWKYKEKALLILRKNFPKSKTKMKEGIFVGSQVKRLVEDHDFSTKSNSTEIRTWEASEISVETS